MCYPFVTTALDCNSACSGGGGMVLAVLRGETVNPLQLVNIRSVGGTFTKIGTWDFGNSRSKQRERFNRGAVIVRVMAILFTHQPRK